jgi:hypothetical protein
MILINLLKKVDSSINLLKKQVGSCEHHNEPLHSIKHMEFLDDLSNYELVKKYSFHWSWLVVIA